MFRRHTLALAAALGLAACSASHTGTREDSGVAEDAAPEPADAIAPAPPPDVGPPPVLDAGGGPCDGLGPAACFADPGCAPVFDDACCPDCSDGPCTGCADPVYFGCIPFDDCRAPSCGTVPAWGCGPAAPDCSAAVPLDMDSCSMPGCVPSWPAETEDTSLVDATCVPIAGDSCTVACRRIAPDCPDGTVPEGDGFCYTDRCIAAFVCE